MKIEVIPAANLSADHLAAWSRLQRSEPNLASPFFRPEFTLAVAAERDDVKVVVWEQGGEPVGFLPFECASKRVGRAVGSYMNLFQGAIVRSGVEWSPEQVVRATGLRSWQFDHLCRSQSALVPYQYVVVDSPYLDLSQGFEHYRKGRGKSAATFISHIGQKERKAGRDLGEVVFESRGADDDTLGELLAWKIDQCRRTQIRCVFGFEWMVRLHKRLLRHSSEDFAGMLFSLRVGGRLAAAFYCLRSRHVLQGSVLGFDRELGPFAPGLVLLMQVAKAAGEMGITRIDLGSGGEQYKDKLASGCEQVTEGAVYAQPTLAPLYRSWVRARDRLRETPLRGPVRRVRRWMLSTRILLGYTD